ncbi:hypothetical protein OHA87_47700 (plasmid) [Streptomyces sp. NBC_00493]|uniref:hypothetical protein n=1 Tax=Streptomyces sp. NBC_00493 TaxID=2975759 RepID=UPI002E199050
MNWILNVLLSLVAGSVGSVVFTPLSQRLGEAAKTRYSTERHLHGTLCAYRQELEYQYDRSRTQPHGFPPQFASVEGQEKLSEDVLRSLPDLKKRLAKATREDLQKLVGPTMLTFAEGRTFVPADIRRPEVEQIRLQILNRRISLEPGRYSEGLLQKLMSAQNQPHEHIVHYENTLAILDGMAERVSV